MKSSPTVTEENYFDKILISYSTLHSNSSSLNGDCYYSQREEESKKRQELNDTANHHPLNELMKAFPIYRKDKSLGRFVKDFCFCDNRLCRMIHKSRPRFRQLQSELRQFNRNCKDHNWKYMDVHELDKRWSRLFEEIYWKIKT